MEIWSPRLFAAAAKCENKHAIIQYKYFFWRILLVHVVNL